MPQHELPYDQSETKQPGSAKRSPVCVESRCFSATPDLRDSSLSFPLTLVFFNLPAVR